MRGEALGVFTHGTVETLYRLRPHWMTVYAPDIAKLNAK